MASKINIEQYIGEIKKRMNLNIKDDIIKKDLLLTLILAEFEKMDLGRELIFKGGTLLSRNYLKYHRFSEDLDFVFKDSNSIRELTRSARERKVKAFLDIFVPKLKEAADILGLDFSTDRSNKKYCRMLKGRTVYTFKIYYSDENFIKVEINFIEEMLNKPAEQSIKTITDFFDSRELMFILGLKIDHFKVLSYPLEEIILEKYRALLTRNKLAERDLFDLFLIPNSLNVDTKQVTKKIKSSSLIKRDLASLIREKLLLLKECKFFESEEKIEELALAKYNPADFEKFKENIKPILIEICRDFLKE
ncbi:nucleotidyl transferase AbiEii/AbiGii toxin family protein [Candidatus Pacearchaeota archaeon]|nr:nucleotidyl transferase AbiEii/AbiGii toxin family protein [Candidatus Pacearchaeota archaeon]